MWRCSHVGRSDMMEYPSLTPRWKNIFIPARTSHMDSILYWGYRQFTDSNKKGFSDLIMHCMKTEFQKINLEALRTCPACALSAPSGRCSLTCHRYISAIFHMFSLNLRTLTMSIPRFYKSDSGDYDIPTSNPEAEIPILNNGRTRLERTYC